MPAFTLPRKLFVRATLVIFAMVMLAGCMSKTPSQSGHGQNSAASAEYLRQLLQSSEDDKSALQLLAARTLLQEGNLGPATEQLRTLPQQLPENQQNEKQLIQAEIQLAQGDYANASETLKAVAAERITIVEQRSRYQEVLAKIEANKLNSLPIDQPETITKIALLLPLSGQAKVYSQAIEQGFNAGMKGVDVKALNVTGLEENHTTASTNSTPQIALYDTSAKPLDLVITQAEQEGASVIVGPLLKNQVDQLTRINLKHNVLALNQPENVSEHTNICYFALSPENEAQEAAGHIWAQNKQSPLLLIPRGELGQRVAKAFAKQWQSEGGNEVLMQVFGSTIELKATINQGSGIRLAGQPVVTEVDNTAPLAVEQGAGKIDAIYIVATPAEMALLKPMLAMENTTEQPAMYASSRSYQLAPTAEVQLEIEGMEYSDIPLLTGKNPELQKQLSTQFNNDNMLVRLYAMGMDAWSLINRFKQLQQGDALGLEGYTGTFGVEKGCVITRRPSWLKFQQGQWVPVQ